ncbi:MAG: hypothetical protein WAL71_02065 [Terriglobales bacterium]
MPEVEFRGFSVRGPARYWTYRLRPNREYDNQYAAISCRADGKPALLVSFHLIFQKDVIAGQHIFSIGAADIMIREMRLVPLVPVEVRAVSH